MKLKYTLIALALGSLLYAEQVKIDMHGGKESKIVTKSNLNKSATTSTNKAFKKKESYTIEELYAFSNELNGQTITVKGKVTKVLKGIMEKDWVHLSDETGKKEDKTNDLTLTTKNANIKVGDSVIAKGKLIKDKDFGSGYFYKVIIEDTNFTK